MSGSARPFQQARQDQPSRGWLRNSLATVCISGTLEDKLKAAAAAGFDGVELFEPDLLGAAFRPREIRDTCRDLGLSIDLYQPFRDFDAADPQQYSANLRRAEHKFDVMQHVGTDLILVCSSVAPGCSKDDDQIAEQLHELAIRAAGRGLRICYEALAWGRHVGTYQHSWDIVQRADHPALGVCIDSFHILSRGSDPAGIRSIPGEKIFFLQLADAPQLDMGVLQWSRHYRLFPGQGSFDLTDFVGHVLAAGYRGPLSLEVFNDVFRQSDPNQAAVDALRSLLGLRESVLAQLAPETSPPSVIALPPPVPELSGFAFVELSLDEGSGAAVGDALGALGFTASGRHVSKPVRLLQQSGARVLLNSAGDPLGAAVAALGVETADAPAATRRAAAMLAPALPRSRGPAEADISAVGAPDGTAVFFCPTGTDAATGWLADFAGADGAGSGIGITHVDHVALTQPFDRFDEAALFYRCLLGLQTQHASEVAAPFGLVRNRAVANRDCSVRICLSVSVLRRGSDWQPGVSDPQHIAFATGNAIGAARAARSAGAPVLAIGDNYYDDLEARLDLPVEQLTAMRELGILFDRDAQGDFLHFYTEVLGGRVFFEVVQRIGGYSGYGEVNAPIRMAAHRRQRGAP